jgi:beta-N-acetylhexosaminidase
MVIVGFRGVRLGVDLPIVHQIQTGQVGGVILYGTVAGTGAPMNIVSASQVKALVTGLRALTSSPLLIATDEEGGQVDRLATLFGSTLSEAQLGASGNVATTVDQTATIASHLQSLGINLDLAPDVDLALAPGGFIARDQRSFSADPAVVGRLARAEVSAYRRHGILTTPKHFPGYGTVSSAVDAYRTPPDITSTWQASELDPYRQLIAAGDADLVMVSSQINRKLDPAGWPASLSPAIVGGLLRKVLGFQGLVISDDLQSGITNNPAYGLVTAVRQSLLAGVDLLLFSNNNPEAPYDANIGPEAAGLIAQLASEDPAICRNVQASLSRISALGARIG